MTLIEEGDETRFETITECVIDLSTRMPKDSNSSPVELHITDEVPLSGFLDPLVSHTFFCGPADQSQSVSGLTYSIEMSRLQEDEPDELIPDQVQNTYDSVRVKENILPINSDF